MDEHHRTSERGAAATDQDAGRLVGRGSRELGGGLIGGMCGSEQVEIVHPGATWRVVSDEGEQREAKRGELSHEPTHGP